MVSVSYLLTGLIFFVVSKVSVEADEDDMMSCLQLFDPEGVQEICCESLQNFDKGIDESLSECLDEDSEEWLCEDFQCLLNITGMLKDDKIDEDGARTFYDQLESDNPKEKLIIERVKHECLGGKYETYPPEDACPAVKFYVCSYINAYLECDTWKDLEVCSKMADNAKKCKAALKG